MRETAGRQRPRTRQVAAVFTLVVAALLLPARGDARRDRLHAVWGLFDVEPMARYRQLNRPDFWAVLTALLGVLLFDTLPGLMLAVAVSIGLLIYHASRPRLSALGESPDHTDLADLAQPPTYVPIPGAGARDARTERRRQGSRRGHHLPQP